MKIMTCSLFTFLAILWHGIVPFRVWKVLAIGPRESWMVLVEGGLNLSVYPEGELTIVSMLYALSLGNHLANTSWGVGSNSGSTWGKMGREFNYPDQLASSDAQELLVTPQWLKIDARFRKTWRRADYRLLSRSICTMCFRKTRRECLRCSSEKSLHYEWLI